MIECLGCHQNIEDCTCAKDAERREKEAEAIMVEFRKSAKEINDILTNPKFQKNYWKYHKKDSPVIGKESEEKK